MTNATRPTPEHRRRSTATVRALGIASIAAFAGGVAVVGVQHGVGRVSASYPPLVQALLCAPEGERASATLVLGEQSGTVLPIVEVASDTVVECRIEAPGAEYATWSVIGPRAGVRSGPLDSSVPCQSPEDFAGQNTAELRLSSCQRARFDRAGLYMLSAVVMARGHPFVDRGSLAIRVTPREEPPAAPVAKRTRVVATLSIPARQAEVEHKAQLSADFSEHGLLPQSRDFVRTVYRLKPGEEYLSGSFRARSAENASEVTLAYDRKTRAVTASFTLRSGPVIDRWRGWVSGTAVIRLRRAEEAREITLPEATLDVPGRASLPLPEGLQIENARLRLRQPDNEEVVELTLDGKARVGPVMVSARIEEGALLLDAALE
jgi:hypothetical protein